LPRRKLLYLSVEGVERIHASVLAAHGGLSGLRDARLLESAVAAPQASYGGEALIRNAIEIAAAYLFYLCRNHPFADGNKRTALAACLVFLDANGLLPAEDLPARDIDDWEALVLDVSASRIDRRHTTTRSRHLLGRGRRRQPARKR
jgi:death-on-curing protein